MTLESRPRSFQAFATSSARERSTSVLGLVPPRQKTRRPVTRAVTPWSPHLGFNNIHGGPGAPTFEEPPWRRPGPGSSPLCRRYRHGPFQFSDPLLRTAVKAPFNLTAERSSAQRGKVTSRAPTGLGFRLWSGPARPPPRTAPPPSGTDEMGVRWLRSAKIKGAGDPAPPRPPGLGHPARVTAGKAEPPAGRRGNLGPGAPPPSPPGHLGRRGGGASGRGGAVRAGSWRACPGSRGCGRGRGACRGRVGAWPPSGLRVPGGREPAEPRRRTAHRGGRPAPQRPTRALWPAVPLPAGAPQRSERRGRGRARPGSPAPGRMCHQLFPDRVRFAPK